MDIKQKTGLAIGAAVIGAGAVFGVTYALSGNSNGAQAQPTTRADDGGTRADGGGPGRGGMGNLASALAEKLGVDEAKVTEAIQSAMQANRPSGQPSDGSQPGAQASSGARPNQGGFRSGMDETLAKAIADKLGIDQAKVTTALQEVRAEQQANRPSGTNSQAPQPSASPTG